MTAEEEFTLVVLVVLAALAVGVLLGAWIGRP